MVKAPPAASRRRSAGRSPAARWRGGPAPPPPRRALHGTPFTVPSQAASLRAAPCISRNCRPAPVLQLLHICTSALALADYRRQLSMDRPGSGHLALRSVNHISKVRGVWGAHCEGRWRGVVGQRQRPPAALPAARASPTRLRRPPASARSAPTWLPPWRSTVTCSASMWSSGQTPSTKASRAAGACAGGGGGGHRRRRQEGRPPAGRLCLPAVSRRTSVAPMPAASRPCT